MTLAATKEGQGTTLDMETSMFAGTPTSPPDPVFGIMELFRSDRRPNKVNLTVGAYQDETGQTPILKCVKIAEKQMLEREQSKNYLPIDGLPNYNLEVARLIFGNDNEILASNRIAVAQTPGGTGALRIAADFLHRVLGVNTIWICNPTWANHPQIFSAAKFQIKNYPYINSTCTGLDFSGMIANLTTAAAGQAVLLQAVCHNPTGFDLTAPQWAEVLDLVAERRLIPIFDFAYQGFHRGLDQDAEPIRQFCCNGREAIVCNSFSKNFGLYAERVGAISIVTQSADSVNAVKSQIKSIIRTIYSTPPQHGGSIVERVLCDSELRGLWKEEVKEMRERIAMLRGQLFSELQRRIPRGNFDFVKQQIGMFSYSGLSAEQAVRLRNEFAVYIVESGRINVAGLNSQNLEHVGKSIAAVVSTEY